jgi:hypothetical protein
MWMKCSYGLSDSSCSTGSATAYNWNNALAQCEGLDFGGQTDWRLPNVNELLSILNYSTLNPAINSTYFPGTLSENYWTSTTYVANSGAAWSIYFAFNYLNMSSKTSEYYVRCVRGQ